MMANGNSAIIIIVTAVFLSIALVAVCLRCFVRLKIVHAFGRDDALIVTAMVLYRMDISVAPTLTSH
jgi:cation-transporting ATPase 13A1